MKKLAFISDTHGKHHEIKIEPCDILFHSGDISNIGAAMEIADFINWFKQQPAKNKVFIAGNHDRGLDWNYSQTRKYPADKLLSEQNYFDIQEQIKYLPSDIHYLQDEELEISVIILQSRLHCKQLYAQVDKIYLNSYFLPVHLSVKRSHISNGQRLS